MLRPRAADSSEAAACASARRRASSRCRAAADGGAAGPEGEPEDAVPDASARARRGRERVSGGGEEIVVRVAERRVRSLRGHVQKPTLITATSPHLYTSQDAGEKQSARG